MTLVLSLEWSAAAITAAVTDTAIDTVVSEGIATVPADTPDDWWSATCAATRAAVDGAIPFGADGKALRSIIVGGHEPPGGLVVIDAAGDVVRCLTGTHPDSKPDAEWLVSHLDGGADAWSAATGLVPFPGSTVALLSWLHRSEPDAWQAMARITVPSGWLVERLGGAPAVDAHVAVGTGVLDRAARTWRTDLLAVVDSARDWLPMLPAVTTTADPVGMVSADAASATGLPVGISIHVGERR